MVVFIARLLWRKLRLRFVFEYGGTFANSHVSDAGGRLRPTISLISSTTISEGSGTSEDPYVIK